MKKRRQKANLQTKIKYGHTASGVTTQVSELNYHYFPIRNKTIRFCEIFNLYLKIYYSTAEWSDDDHDFDFDYGNADEQYSHAEIIDQCDFRQVHLIDSHVYSNTTLLQPRENTQFTSDSVSDKGDINDGDHPIQQERKTFPTMLKLIIFKSI